MCKCSSGSITHLSTWAKKNRIKAFPRVKVNLHVTKRHPSVASSESCPGHFSISIPDRPSWKSEHTLFNKTREPSVETE